MFNGIPAPGLRPRVCRSREREPNLITPRLAVSLSNETNDRRQKCERTIIKFIKSTGRA